eukprot:5572741-Alexandrium_andersonii.AAC.1
MRDLEHLTHQLDMAMSALASQPQLASARADAARSAWTIRHTAACLSLAGDCEAKSRRCALLRRLDAREASYNN